MTYRVEGKHSLNAVSITNENGGQEFTIMARRHDFGPDQEEMLQRANRITEFLNNKASFAVRENVGSSQKWHMEERRPNSATNAVHIFEESKPLITVWAKANTGQVPNHIGGASITSYADGSASLDQDELYERAHRVSDFLNNDIRLG